MNLFGSVELYHIQQKKRCLAAEWNEAVHNKSPKKNVSV